MPSRSVHWPDELYDYIRDTIGDGETFSSRAVELARKGKQSEGQDHA
jgi:hypothetical protein